MTKVQSKGRSLQGKRIVKPVFSPTQKGDLLHAYFHGKISLYLTLIAASTGLLVKYPTRYNEIIDFAEEWFNEHPFILKGSDHESMLVLKRAESLQFILTVTFG